jgi:hypothetical protein
MPDEPRFELLEPDQDVTKLRGYCWVEVDHHIVDREDGVYAIVPVRCRFSFTFSVLADELVKNPGTSEHNPAGLPEMTILAGRCSELGRCERPALVGTTASIRLAD